MVHGPFHLYFKKYLLGLNPLPQAYGLYAADNDEQYGWHLSYGPVQVKINMDNLGTISARKIVFFCTCPWTTVSGRCSCLCQ
jgi:hypothetical protein